PPAPPAVAGSDDDDDDDLDDDGQSSPPPARTFVLDGVAYPTYQAMVDAKRRRNLAMLAESGLLEAKAAVDDAIHAEKAERKAATASRGLKRSAPVKKEPMPLRKSSRLAGATAVPIYVEHEVGGRFEISGAGGSTYFEPEKPEFFNGRVNDGSDLTASEAVELNAPKWVKEGTVEAAEHFMRKVLPEVADEMPLRTVSKKGSPTSVAKGPASSSPSPKRNNLRDKLHSLSLDDRETTGVAKAVPDRIYSVACHPSPSALIVCAGDKQGYLGIWNVDQYGPPFDDAGNETDGVHLFKPHGGAISSLVWNPTGTALLSASYDGSIRSFDADKGVFEEVFATYDDSDMYKDKLGFGTHLGYNSWVQNLEMDHRSAGGKCFFLSTSKGNVMHIDLRSKGKLTFNQTFSEKKINTVSLHPEGNVMATAGLARVVQLWDVRKVSSSKSSDRPPKPLAWRPAGKSVNSAFFSPSGSKILATTQCNKLDILEDAHLASGVIKPYKSVSHDNQTGRWLTTFHARWHPSAVDGREIFTVGCMKQPRRIEVFDDDGTLLREVRGEALTNVASRCCFHPDPDKLVIVGGTSSGRVTVAR
ncbi:hypothetical protein ACHAWF_007241, partial [Thalassiosira exigua]